MRYDKLNNALNLIKTTCVNYAPDNLSNEILDLVKEDQKYIITDRSMYGKYGIECLDSNVLLLGLDVLYSVYMSKLSGSTYSDVIKNTWLLVSFALINKDFFESAGSIIDKWSEYLGQDIYETVNDTHGVWIDDFDPTMYMSASSALLTKLQEISIRHAANDIK